MTPRMRFAEQECWSLGLAFWAALCAGTVAWTTTRRVTRGQDYRP